MKIVEMIDIIKNPPRWSQLNTIGNSNLAKATILIPFIGYFIVFNDIFVDNFTLSNQFVSKILMEPSYKIFFSYFGLTFFAIGSIIFNLRCPETIKYYPDDLEYISLEKENTTDVFAEHVRDQVEKYINSPKFKEIKRSGYLGKLIASINTDKSENIDTQIKLDGEYTIALLSTYWMIKNREYTVWRLLCFYSYIIGFILLSIPSIDTLIGVCKAFLKKLYLEYFLNRP